MKWYEPTRRYTIIIPTRIGNTTIMIPYLMTDYEDYCIRIKGINSKGKEVERTVYLTEERWNTVQKGEYFCIDGNCYTSDPNNTKERER